MSNDNTATPDIMRCGWQCPHGDRCTLERGHAGGCNYRVCDCNERSIEYIEPTKLQRDVAVLSERAARFEAENAKLRELVRLLSVPPWHHEAKAFRIATLRRELRLDGEG
jgi:hypothetical protein